MITIILWILVLFVALYLGIGLFIYYRGTRDKREPGTVIHRTASQRLAFKKEKLDITLHVSAASIPREEKTVEPWHILLVIDKSGSMSSLGGISHAREAAYNLVASTPGEFSFAVVEFEEYARVSCHFTHDKATVKNALDKIQCSGGTAIHEGLKIAHELIRDESPPPEHTAVILMSDGGSEKEAAVKQAQVLHEAGIPLFTVGFSHCDKDLLRDIAYESLRFFYADDPSGLKYFFHLLGRKIRNNCAHDVEVTEYPNISAAPFELAGWGKLPPLEAGGLFDREQPVVKWFLTGLDLAASSIQYRLKSDKCGWFPVAHDKARISMKNAEEKEESFKSNPGPYVLVIPRFFMWQIFWIFLNPLFWMIKRRVFKAESRPEPDDTVSPEAAAKIPATDIAEPQVIPVPEPSFPIDVDPTLVIGVGYGGIHALTHLKRFLWEHNQDQIVSRKVIFTAIDTVKPYFSETVSSGPVYLESSEKQNLYLDTSQTHSNPGGTGIDMKYQWLDMTGLNAEGIDYGVGAGAGSNPAVGRLILLQNRDKIERLTPVIRQLHETAPNRPLNICISAAMGGGTSSGILLDLCYAIKQITQRLDLPQKSIALFLMDAHPDDDEPGRESKMEIYLNNKTALIRQLARFFAARNSAFSTAGGYEALPQWFDYIFWSTKKRDSRNHNDLYPQTAAMMYEWTIERSFRDYIRNQSQYVSSGLLVHSGRAEGLFLYKRLLEHFYSAKLVLKVLTESLVGFSGVVTNFSLEHCDCDEKTIAMLIDILLKKTEWLPSRPRLLRDIRLIAKPDSVNLTRFLASGGFKEISENSSADEIDYIIRREADAFSNLVFTWLEFIIATHQDRDKEPVQEFKLPNAYFALEHLKKAVERLCDLGRGISLLESPFDQKQCHVLVRMGDRFIQILDQWAGILKSWLDLLGEGVKGQTGLGRRLKERMEHIEKMLKQCETMRMPHFQMNDNLKDKIYEEYFQGLENNIIESIYWLPKPGGQVKMGISGFDRPHYYRQEPGNDEFEDIFRQLTTLPGGFAARSNEWHRFSIDDFLELSSKYDGRLEKDYLIPSLNDTVDESVCFMNTVSFERLSKPIPVGISHYTVESNNPLARGFFHFRLNDEIFSAGDDDEFEALPPFVFAEEWNCYNALAVFRRLTRNRIQSPPFSLVALCRDFKKFLGAVKYGVIDNNLRPDNNGNRLVHRFGNLKEIPASGNDEADVLKLLGFVIDSTDTATAETLDRSFRELLALEKNEIETGIMGRRLPFSEEFKVSLYRVVYGGAEYYKHQRCN